MKEQFLNLMRQIVQEGGEIALDLLNDNKPTLKPDQSVLTETDTAISALTRRVLGDLLETKEHILIDEEDPRSVQHFDSHVLESTPYIWAVDPIDGTRNYANHVPVYGVSIGLIKNCKPWLGCVFFPALNELFYTDGNKAYFVKRPFCKDTETSEISFIDQEITQQSEFYLIEKFLKNFNWDYNLCHILIPACAVSDLCWPAIGRGCGCMFKAHLWDFAGSWPVFQKAGLELRSIESGTVLDTLNILHYMGVEGNVWRLKDHYILSSERNFGILRQNITKKQVFPHI